MEKLRVDKYLWAIRLFKTRTASSKACEAGHVKQGNDKLKASSKIQEGDKLTVRVNHINREIEVVKLISKRVGAAIAKECYIDHTPPEALVVHKMKSAFLLPNAYRDKGTGRPTKKDRRDIDKFKDIDNLEDIE